VNHRVLIVDDERLARVALRSLLSERSDVDIVGEASSVATAKQAIAELDPDVLLLDVQMPDGTGFDLLKQIDVDCDVVFVTAYDTFAVRAFDVNALDYLVKPLAQADVTRVLRRLTTSGVSTTSPPARLELDDTVCLHEGQRMRFVSVREIVYIGAAGDYTDVHLVNGLTVLAPVALRDWEFRLPTRCFVRAHRSNLVNLGFIEEVINAGGVWTMRLRCLDTELPMSRRFARALKSRFEVGGLGDPHDR
jgi:two-component system, LytTR family, response regulator